MKRTLSTGKTMKRHLTPVHARADEHGQHMFQFSHVGENSSTSRQPCKRQLLRLLTLSRIPRQPMYSTPSPSACGCSARLWLHSRRISSPKIQAEWQGSWHNGSFDAYAKNNHGQTQQPRILEKPYLVCLGDWARADDICNQGDASHGARTSRAWYLPL